MNRMTSYPWSHWAPLTHSVESRHQPTQGRKRVFEPAQIPAQARRLACGLGCVPNGLKTSRRR